MVQTHKIGHSKAKRNTRTPSHLVQCSQPSPVPSIHITIFTYKVTIFCTMPKSYGAPLHTCYSSEQFQSSDECWHLQLQQQLGVQLLFSFLLASVKIAIFGTLLCSHHQFDSICSKQEFILKYVTYLRLFCSRFHWITVVSYMQITCNICDLSRDVTRDPRDPRYITDLNRYHI